MVVFSTFCWQKKIFFFCFIFMKISHKLCVRMNGPEFIMSVRKIKKLTLFWILNGCGSGLGLGFWILALAGIAQMICSFVVVRVVVAVAVVVVVAAAVVVDNTNHVEKDFGSTDFPVEMQHFVDLGCYTKFVGGFVVASEDSVVASE